ncbi:efflux RND transporter periplasmic adaptor subunit [Nibrella viscosa]|uniref:Efflux RND transporter periplasmic adaptor subunit n=1 Tax=Nibrella viscosa TaxID=1084524 RepID=A0ABP8K5A0_9BACT
MKYVWILSGLLTMAGCGHKENTHPVAAPPNTHPEVTDQGRLILFPDQPSILNFFQTERLNTRALSADLKAPGHVVATVVTSGENRGQPLVLFDNPQLTANYAELIQHLTNIRQISEVNIKQKEIELARAKDLAEHGAATGREVLDAQTALAMEKTNLANEKAQMVQHETELQLAGFDPVAVRRARPGQAWLICDVSESQINKLHVGHACTIRFTAYPDETVNGRIDAFGDVVDNITRTIKLRISLPNPQGRFRAGMFATVAFGVSEGQFMSVPQTALVTVQGKDYVFVRHNEREFERREVMAGQQINDRIIVFRGLKEAEEVVTKGAMQLKGLSFGY